MMPQEVTNLTLGHSIAPTHKPGLARATFGGKVEFGLCCRGSTCMASSSFAPGRQEPDYDSYAEFSANEIEFLAEDELIDIIPLLDLNVELKLLSVSVTFSHAIFFAVSASNVLKGNTTSFSQGFTLHWPVVNRR